MKYLSFVAAVVALTLGGCAAQHAPSRIEFDETHDFSDYRTFSWIAEHPMKVGPVVADPRDSIEPKIMAAVRAELEGKGFEFVEPGKPADFVVSFTVGSRESVRPDGYPSMSPKAGGRWSWGTEYHHGEEGGTFTQGVLAIDMFDVDEKRPIWHGVAGRRINESDREDMTGLIGSVVATILGGFPP
jgi:hypothetical protein